MCLSNVIIRILSPSFLLNCIDGEGPRSLPPMNFEEGDEERGCKESRKYGLRKRPGRRIVHIACDTARLQLNYGNHAHTE
jgi:hypothetical protein